MEKLNLILVEFKFGKLSVKEANEKILILFNINSFPNDTEIENAHSKMINLSNSVGFVNGAKWMRNFIFSRISKNN